MTLFIGLATSAYSVGIPEMTKEFGVAEVSPLSCRCRMRRPPFAAVAHPLSIDPDSKVVGQVGMFVFNAAFSFVPLFMAPLSETVGRNPGASAVVTFHARARSAR